MKIRELEDWRESHMNRELNMNLDGREPEEEDSYFLRKLEVGLYLQKFVDGERTWKTYLRVALSNRTFYNDENVLYLKNPVWLH